MSAAHTPGPWIVTARKVTTVDGTGIASPIVGEWGYFQASSNLQLMAAAPDLLDALQSFVDHGTCFSEDDMQKARAAIAKATGDAK